MNDSIEYASKSYVMTAVGIVSAILLILIVISCILGIKYPVPTTNELQSQIDALTKRVEYIESIESGSDTSAIIGLQNQINAINAEIDSMKNSAIFKDVMAKTLILNSND